MKKSNDEIRSSLVVTRVSLTSVYLDLEDMIRKSSYELNDKSFEMVKKLLEDVRKSMDMVQESIENLK